MEQTREWIKQAQNGNEKAKEQLIEENKGLIWSIARRFSGRGYELEDIYQIGAIGLLKCIDHFDLEYQVRFSTYAVPMILGEIRRFFRDDGMLKVSRPLKELYLRAIKIRNQMEREQGKEITIQELAKALSISTETLVEALEANHSVESLSQTIYESADGHSVCMYDHIGKEEEEEIVNHIFLQNLLCTLPEKERQIISLRYLQDKTQQEIAKMLGITQVQVSRIEKRVLVQLRKMASIKQK